MCAQPRASGELSAIRERLNTCCGLRSTCVAAGRASCEAMLGALRTDASSSWHDRFGLGEYTQPTCRRGGIWPCARAGWCGTAGVGAAAGRGPPPGRLASASRLHQRRHRKHAHSSLAMVSAAARGSKLKPRVTYNDSDSSISFTLPVQPALAINTDETQLHRGGTSNATRHDAQLLRLVPQPQDLR